MHRIPHNFVHRLLLLLALQLCALVAHGASLVPYHAAPPADFTLQGTDGQPYNLNEFKDKVVLINFWATYCSPCIKELPSMQHLAARLKDKPFVILAVSMGEESSTVQAFLERLQLAPNFPILLDSDSQVSDTWRINGLPTSYLIDRRGEIRYRAVGGVAWDSPDTLARIEPLLKR